MKNLFLFLFIALPLMGMAQTDSVLVMPDVHLDLTLKPTSFYHTDTDTTLFLSAVGNLGAQKFPFILMAGDFLSHRPTHDPANMAKTFKYIIDHVQNIDPSAVILPALGNNDCLVHNTSGKETYDVFYKSMLKRIDKNDAIYKTFSTGGYYSYETDSLSVIALNTLLCAWGPFQDAKNEMDWLGKTLQADRRAGKKAWLFYHVPPGIDKFNGRTTWDAGVQQMYLDTIKKYAAIIKFQLSGHTHMDDCRLITDKGKLISYVAIAPGLDSRNGNNPAYQVMHFDVPSKTIRKVYTWYTDSAHPYQWFGFGFTALNYNFILHYNSNSPEGRDFVNHYSTDRPMKRMKWNADFCNESIISTN